MTQPRLVHFLLVEDDDDHATLIMRSLQRSRVSNQVDRVKDGEAALEARKAAELAPFIEAAMARKQRLRALDDTEIPTLVALGRQVAAVPEATGRVRREASRRGPAGPEATPRRRT